MANVPIDAGRTYSVQEALAFLQQQNGGKPLTDDQKSQLANSVLGHGVDANDTNTQITADQLAQAQSIVGGYGNTPNDAVTVPTGTTGTMGPGGSDWWTQNSPQFTGPGPAPSTSLPSWLQGPWNPSGSAPTPPNFNAYALPTADQLKAMPGYQVGLDEGQQAIQRSAAARGSVLNPDTVKDLSRFATDYAGTQYSNLAGLGLAVNSANNQNQQTNFTDAYNNYLSNYGQQMSTRQQNVGEFQQNLGNQYSEFNTNTTNQRNTQTDYWNRLLGLYTGGVQSSLGSGS